MVVELRKRKAPPTQPELAQKKTATAKATKKTKTAKPSQSASENAQPKVPASKAGKASSSVPKVGDVISLEGFGGEIQTHDGESTTLQSLVADSKAGVVLFTYPRASTPGCKLITFLAWFASRRRDYPTLLFSWHILYYDVIRGSINLTAFPRHQTSLHVS